jgi:predicted short-subunit dehydrogenase-like oxidoreductase (DUF2520 family)
MKIVLLGAGNVAHHLGPLLKKKGHVIMQVYSPTFRNGKELALKLKCSHVQSISEISNEADIYIVALKDDAISNVINKITFRPRLIVHTSGSIGIDVFPKQIRNTGVLYPLQTFSKNSKTTPQQIPMCIEGSNKKSLEIIRKLANSISPMVYKVNSDKRRIIHLAAVFANNFTNYLFSLSAKILEKNNIKFEILLPLINETINKISKEKPANIQTGPARRNDKAVIKKHLKLLSNDAEVRKVYSILSKSIARRYAQ